MMKYQIVVHYMILRDTRSHTHGPMVYPTCTLQVAGHIHSIADHGRMDTLLILNHDVMH
jgi:hypothetical protein